MQVCSSDGNAGAWPAWNIWDDGQRPQPGRKGQQYTLRYGTRLVMIPLSLGDCRLRDSQRELVGKLVERGIE